MQSIELIRENLRRSESIVLSRIEEMRDHALVMPTVQGGCHTLWLLGHLAYIEGLVIDQFMLGRVNPLQHWKPIFDGDEVASEADPYPTFEEVLGECRARRSATCKLLNSLQETDLDQASAQCPAPALDLFGDYRKCFQYVADHWFMHRGQLAVARRAAGVDRMWF